MQTLVKQQVFTYTEKSSDSTAIVVAAGSALRMGGLNKLLMPLCDTPVIIRTLRAFDKSLIDNVVLVVKKEDVLKYQQLLDEYKIKKVSDIVPGGETRAISVKNGLERVKTTKLLVHDGARPLVTPELINNIILKLNDNVAVAPGIKVIDTVKKTNGDYIKETIPRDDLVLIQTPQGFNTKKYLECLKYLESDVTDDCMLFEKNGIPVLIVPGSAENIKITTMNDIPLLEAIIERRGEE